MHCIPLAFTLSGEYIYLLQFLYTMLNIYIYYTALLNAVERSVHLYGPSRLPVVNYFSIMTVAKPIMTAVKESHVSRITAHLVR